MAGKISGRIKRAISSSLILFAVAGVLAAANVYSQNRDRQAALGPESQAQKRFFIDAVDRPDISAFYKRFKSAEKVQAAKNLGRYDDPKMVKLATIWLTDFDTDARKELEAVLVALAPRYPTELAAELDKSGGFQKLGVAKALRSAFEKTLPAVIDQLDIAAARNNTVEYLAASGKDVGPILLPKLEAEDKDTRLAAADALGKVGYQPAGALVRRLYTEAEPADQSAYLAALANLGDPESEAIFRQTLQDGEASSGDRASSILGLGRIASPNAIRLLAGELAKRPLDKPQIIEALSLAGEHSLDADLSMEDQLEVAGGIQGAQADRVIAAALANPTLTYRAAELAVQRPSLVPALADRLGKLDPLKDGRTIETLVHALATTPQGQSTLKTPALQNRFGGFIQRRTHAQ